MTLPAESARSLACFALLGLGLALPACGRTHRAAETGASGAQTRTANDPLGIVGAWHAELTSPGGALGFGLHISAGAEGYAAEIENGPERLALSSVTREGEQLVLRFDGYDSEIRARVEDGALIGSWSKTAPKGRAGLPFGAERAKADSPRLRCTPLRADATGSPASVAGTWSLEFSEADGSTYVGRAEFEHEVGKPELRGTIMTDTGDYRYLAGCYQGGSLALSVFDGAHAFLFRARVGEGPHNALEGDFWSRDSYHATFTGTPLAPGDADPLADPWTALPLPASGRFRFDFPDTAGTRVTHEDPRFAGKVVLVDIFGTWCPNCNDQAPQLAAWHARYASQGLELVGLAYEFTGEPERDAAYLGKYAKRYGIEFPLLLAGTSDKGDAASTLPDLERVHAYPTTVFIDRGGAVRKIYSGYFGPATGPRHAAMIAEHEALIEQLLAESAPRPPGPPADGSADELHRLEGQAQEALLAEFGAPTRTHGFTMGECCSEFEIELLNTYPPKAGHEQVEIRQLDWVYEGYTLTVWLHRVDTKWIALETSRYSDGVEF